jgi:hypothetical protein
MTARPFYQSGRDQTYWRPPLPVPNPCALPPSHHVLVWAPPAFLCSACDFATHDPGEAARHLTRGQFTVGSRPEPVAIEPLRGMADEKGDEA